MKTIIIYESKHHGNTKKVCDRVAAECQVELMNKSNPNEDELKAAVEFVKKVEKTYEK